MRPRDVYEFAVELLDKGFLDAACETFFRAALEALKEIARKLGTRCESCSPEEAFEVVMLAESRGLKVMRYWKTAMAILSCDQPPNAIKRLAKDVEELIRLSESDT
ncbi:MAG: hypothetical protein ACP5HQ_00810 [Thermoprotei archaeon]